MQLFSADATMLLFLNKHFFALENMKKPLSESAPIFFQRCQPAQNQPKSNFLFHKNVSLHDFNVMTLILSYHINN